MNEFISNPSDSAVIRYVQSILEQALAKGASDLHFEAYEQCYRVRMRIDGLLHETPSPEPHLTSRIVARLKVMSGLDIAEKRFPQDGRARIQDAKQQYHDLRISTCPMVHGEKCVIRILDSNRAMLGIEQLGMHPRQQALFSQAVQQPQGMILVTGPTGSGKTVTLYSALNVLNQTQVNISTVEDPVEMYVEGINQVTINNKAGLDFATVLRAFLRQDPDIIMVGEMRDRETAEIGIKAAQTGHLVLSTLHTNNTAESLTRLINMGLPRYNIATSISLIIAQRLARKLCGHCKREQTLSEKMACELGLSKTVFEANPSGCDYCTLGFYGRIGIYELLAIDQSISQMILDNASAIDIRKYANSHGMSSLRHSGLQYVKEGLTSLSELNRVIKE